MCIRGPNKTAVRKQPGCSQSGRGNSAMGVDGSSRAAGTRLAGALLGPLRVSVAIFAAAIGFVANGPLATAQLRSAPAPGEATQPPSRQPAAGAELLVNAIRFLEARRTISVRIRQQINLFDKELVGTGTYLEERSEQGLRFRLESKIRLGEETGTLLEVCDGEWIWRYRRLHGEGTLGRIKVDRVVQALEEAGHFGRMEAIEHWPGLGGLAKLLRGLQANFDFVDVQQVYLNSAATDGTLGAVPLPVWRVRGLWKREKLAELLENRREEVLAGKAVDLSELPLPLPHSVVFYLAADDLFPHRIEYYRSRPQRAGEGRGVERPIVVVELTHLITNVPIDPNRFSYNPGNLACPNQTLDFLRQLGLEE